MSNRLLALIFLISCYVGGYVAHAMRIEVAAVRARREFVDAMSDGDFRDVQFDTAGWNATTIEVLTPFEPSRDLTAGGIYMDRLLYSPDEAMQAAAGQGNDRQENP